MIELKDLLPYAKKLKLLCVDSDSATRQSLVKTFSRIFAQVDDAADGYDGLNHYKINQHDLIITETDLGTYSALQMIEQVKKISPSQHIIVISKNKDSELLLKWINLGIDGFVLKPISMRNLLEIMYKSCTVLYSDLQKLQQIAMVKQLKEQKRKLQEHYETNELRLSDALGYERKRLGRMLGEEKALQARLVKEEELVKKLKYFDDLTGLPNKYSLKEGIDKEGDKALLFIDMDYFDTINTLYGMGYGNKILCESAKKIGTILPENATLFRISADEFVILIFSPTSEQAIVLSKDILSLFKNSALVINDIEFDIGFSIGMDKGTHNKLFAHAKTAAQEAKVKGRDRLVIYQESSEYIKAQKQTLYMIENIKYALKNGKVKALYYPIRSNKMESIQKYESVYNIINKDGQLISIDSFVYSDSFARLSTKVTRVFIDEIFQFFQSNEYPFYIKISTHDLNENYLEEFLQYKCDYYHISAQRIYIELVQNSISNINEEILQQIKRLRAKGFNIVVSNFAIEESLLRSEAKVIKIDAQIIKDIDTNLSNQVIVEEIVNFAKKVGAKTVVEGVYNRSIYEKILQLGVDYSQGLYIGEAVSEIDNTLPKTLSSANNIAI